MNEEYKLLSILMLLIDLVLFEIPVHLDTFLQISTMCICHEVFMKVINSDSKKFVWEHYFNANIVNINYTFKVILFIRKYVICLIYV